jgi:hypothetical protein
MLSKNINEREKKYESNLDESIYNLNFTKTKQFKI